MTQKQFQVKYTYKGLGKRFTEKIKKAVNKLKIFPNGYDTTGFKYRGYDIHFLSSESYLLFFGVDVQKREVTILRVLQDGQDWEYIIEQWLKMNVK